MGKYDLVIWDFDGTVADTAPGIYESIEAALHKMGMENPGTEMLSKFVGPPLTYSAREYLSMPDEVVDGFVKSFRQHYQSIGLYNATVFAGMQETLEALRADGIKIAIATLKPLYMARQLLEHFALDSYFDYCYGGSTDEKGGTTKSDMMLKAMENLGITDKHRAVMVGDTVFDYNGAVEAGIDFIGAAWGGHFQDADAAQAGFTYYAHMPQDVKGYVLG